MTHRFESEKRFWTPPLHSLAPLVCLRAHLQCGGEAAVFWCSPLGEKITAAAVAIFGTTEMNFVQTLVTTKFRM